MKEIDFEKIACDILGMTMTEEQAIEYYELESVIDADDFLIKMLDYNVELCRSCGVWKESCDFNEDENMCCCECCPCDCDEE